jgi:phosphoribosyl 1,2-cyclic phosphate phosphodiesterase
MPRRSVWRHEHKLRNRMTNTLALTILGCGSSGGVPRPGSGWGVCDPANPKNRRRRCSLLVERIDGTKATRVLVDTSPDLRDQLLSADVRQLDAVLFTHDHADHTHGIDDLRPLVIHMRRVVDIHADARTSDTLSERFGYIFDTPAGSDYPPIARLWRLDDGQQVTIDGAGGGVPVLPIRVEHGANYAALGFRFGEAAYVPDVSRLPDAAMAALAGLDLLILDALRITRHPTHFSLAESLAVIAELKPKRAVLTNLHVDLDYDRLINELPPYVEPAFDGLRLEISC